MTNYIQKEAFLYGEGDAWWERNKDVVDYGPDDPVLQVIGFINPTKVLEIGCAQGGRLKAITAETGAMCFGIDPAMPSEPDAYEEYISLHRGTADSLPFKNDSFDLAIMGFCLYLIDRDDLFKAVAEADRVLADGGHLVIYDFLPEKPCSRRYEHLDGLTSYKMDYSALFLANPAYRSVKSSVTHCGPGDRTGVHVLKKDLVSAYPPEVLE